jgi:hypothetical protein
MKLLLLALATLAAAAAPAARADGFSPGEETVFSVSYLSLPTGEGRMLVGQPAGDVWPVIFQARTSGVASLLEIREHLVAYWDATRHLSRGSDLNAYEVGDHHVDSARFDRLGGTTTVVEQHRGKQRKVKTFAVPEGALDLTGAFLWLRLQPLEVGQRHELPVVSGTSQFTLVAQVLAREALVTPAGTFDTFKIQVRTALDGKFSTRRDSFLWLADQPGHFLVRASADFAVGSIVAELKSYRPGAQVAAAD